MKSPQKTPPEEEKMSASAGNEPTIDVSAGMQSAYQDDSATPTQNPPAQSSGDSAFGAAVWQSDKRVNGLYHTRDARNSWMSIAGIGWVKLTTVTDSACEAMTILACHARAKSSRIDYAVDAGLTTQIYVW